MAIPATGVKHRDRPIQAKKQKQHKTTSDGKKICKALLLAIMFKTVLYKNYGVLRKLVQSNATRYSNVLPRFVNRNATFSQKLALLRHVPF